MTEGGAMQKCPSCGKAMPGGSGVGGVCEVCLLGVPPVTAMPANTPPGMEEVGEALPRFELIEHLGRGALGNVFKARDQELDRIVAIKAMSAKGGNLEYGERFRRECLAMAKLGHPHIVTLFDFGVEGDLFYLAMEFMEGRSLAERLAKTKSLPEAEAIRITTQICDALQFAHSKGVMHRDVKPANILLDSRGNAKLGDFGLVKGLLPEEFDHWLLTQTGHLVGTPLYMAPEQCERERAVDHRADIYSAGAVLFEMLTGAPANAANRQAKRPRGISKTLRPVIARALHSWPDDRYQRASDFAEDIQARMTRQRRLAMGTAIFGGYAAMAAAGAWWLLAEPKAASDESAEPLAQSLALNPFDQEIDPDAWQPICAYEFDEGAGDRYGGQADLALQGQAFIEGGRLRLKGPGDSAAVTLATGFKGTPEAVAVEVEYYAERYLSFLQSHLEVLQFSQRWDAGIFLISPKWAETGPSLRVDDREPIAPPGTIEPRLGPGTRHHLWIALDGGGYRCWLNGEPLYRAKARESEGISEWEAEGWQLEVGRFEGSVDSLRVWAKPPA